MPYLRLRVVLPALMLGACGALTETRIDLPATTLRPEFHAEATAGPVDLLRDYRLRYTIGDQAFEAGRGEIARAGVWHSSLSHRAPQAVPPGTAVSATWTAVFLSGAQSRVTEAVALPISCYDLAVAGVEFRLDGRMLEGKPILAALEEVDHPEEFELPVGTPLAVRAIVRNRTGAVGAARVRLVFPRIAHVPVQEQPLPEPLGAGAEVAIEFAPVVLRPPADLRYLSGEVVVELGGGPDPGDTDPANDTYATRFEALLR